MSGIVVDAALVERYTADLAKCGAHGTTGVWRPAYTPAWVAAQDQIATWCSDAGLTVRRDAVGSVWGRVEGTGGGKAIVSGSHIDTQQPGGRFDGALGIVAGLTAIRTLKEQFGHPRRPLEVVSFCEEEASRFPAANCWGSRAVIGDIQPHEPDTLRAYDGETIAEAMRAVGLDPARIPEAARDDIESFIELHIEQAPELEAAGLSVGIVQTIAGVQHHRVEVLGRIDHPAAFPMDLRRDALAAAAEIISRVVDTALAMGRPMVATVGGLLVDPIYHTVVPAKVEFTIRTGHTDATTLASTCSEYEALFEEVAAKRRVDVSWQRVGLNRAPCPCDPDIVQLLADTARALGIPAMMMHSSAAHDSQVMAKRCRMGMIFVQSRGGRSHTPAEFTATEHAADGVQILAAALHRLAYS